MMNTELLTNLAKAEIFSFELERGSTPGNVQVFEMHEGIYDLLRNTITEIFLLRVVAHVNERKHGDRLYCLCFLELAVYIETGSSGGTGRLKRKNFHRFVNILEFKMPQ